MKPPDPPPLPAAVRDPFEGPVEKIGLVGQTLAVSVVPGAEIGDVGATEGEPEGDVGTPDDGAPVTEPELAALVGPDRVFGAPLRGGWLTGNIASNPGSVSGSSGCRLTAWTGAMTPNPS